MVELVEILLLIEGVFVIVKIKELVSSCVYFNDFFCGFKGNFYVLEEVFES